MIKFIVAKGKAVIRRACCEARGFGLEDLREGVEMGTIRVETDWTVEANKVLVF